GDPRLHRPLGVQRTAWRDPGSWGTSVPRTTPLRTVTVERFTTIDGRLAAPRGMPSPREMHSLPPSPWSSSSSSQTTWRARRDDKPARAFGSHTWSSK
ncbi:hypothetical protein PMAYCL1PPCAC_00315, partial [Pristionchus mayeri]